MLYGPQMKTTPSIFFLVILRFSWLIRITSSPLGNNGSHQDLEVQSNAQAQQEASPAFQHSLPLYFDSINLQSVLF